MKIPKVICSLEETGARLEEARIEADVKEADLAEALDLSPETLWHYKRGKREWGAQALAVAAVMCGKTPNDVLLVEKPRSIAGPQFQEFDSVDRDHITSALVDLAFLRSLAEKPRATEVFAGAIRNVADRYRRELKISGDEALPAGSTIVHTKDATLVEPPTKKDRTRSGDTPTKSSMVGEGASEYGKKKK